MKRPFPLYQESQVFRAAKKNILDKLIDRQIDDDYETDEELVEHHKQMCLKELKVRIGQFINGDALDLCRNIRNEF